MRFNLLRTVAGPVGEHNNLVLGQVGNRVHRRVVDGVNTPESEQEPGQDDQEAVPDRKCDDAFDHVLLLWSNKL